MTFEQVIEWMRGMHEDTGVCERHFTVICTGPGLALVSTRERDGQDDPVPEVRYAASALLK